MTTIRLVIAAISGTVGLLLTVPIIILVLPFWIVASLTRLIRLPLDSLNTKVLSWQQLIEYEPEIGWKPKVKLNCYARADKVFHVITDSDGWRGQRSLSESELVVFGDSYAFGYGVSDKAFFANSVSGCRIKSIGVNGYNMVQSLMWMQRLSSQLRGKVVVWFIYYGNDLYENLQPNLGHYRMPFARVNGSGGWQIETKHVNTSKWRSNPQRDYHAKLAEICSSTFLAERAYSACEFLIEEGRDLCRQVDAVLVVVSIPDITQISTERGQKLASLAPNESFDPDLPDKKIKAMCETLDVPFVTLRHYLGDEHHK
ncbi:MAG: hypothetical protein ACR2PS_08890, partial [Pseudomonadales bacterium]